MLPAVGLDADVAALVAALGKMVQAKRLNLAKGFDLVAIYNMMEFLAAVRSMETYRHRGAKGG